MGKNIQISNFYAYLCQVRCTDRTQIQRLPAQEMSIVTTHLDIPFLDLVGSNSHRFYLATNSSNLYVAIGDANISLICRELI